MRLPRRPRMKRKRHLGRRASTILLGRNYTVTATGWTNSIVTILTRRKSCLALALTTMVTWSVKLRSRLSWARHSSFLYLRPKTDSSRQQSSNTTPVPAPIPLPLQSTSTSSPNTSTFRGLSSGWTRRAFWRPGGGARSSRPPRGQEPTPGSQTSAPPSPDQQAAYLTLSIRTLICYQT